MRKFLIVLLMTSLLILSTFLLFGCTDNGDIMQGSDVNNNEVITNQDGINTKPNDENSTTEKENNKTQAYKNNPSAEHMYARINGCGASLEYGDLKKAISYETNEHIWFYNSYYPKAYIDSSAGNIEYMISVFFDNINVKSISQEIHAFVLEERIAPARKIDIVEKIDSFKFEDNHLSIKLILSETLPEDELVIFTFDTEMITTDGALETKPITLILRYSPQEYKEYLVGRFSYIRELNNLSATYDSYCSSISYFWDTGETHTLPDGTIINIIDNMIFVLAQEEKICDFESIEVGDTLDTVLTLDPETTIYEATEIFPQETYHFFENRVYIFKYQDGTIFGIEKYIFDN